MLIKLGMQTLSDFASLETVRNRFASYVRHNPSNGCAEWQGSLSKGYGQLWILKKDGTRHRWVASRLAWALHTGETPELDVCHTCDNRKCVNVEHLFLGTNDDNISDKIAKGRHTHGETVPQSKLTEGQVIDIRRNADRSCIKDLAWVYDMSSSNIAMIINRTTWKHL